MPKYGINVGLGFKESVEEQVPVIAKVGYSSCFTNWEPGCDVKGWARVIRECGLVYQSIHAPFGQVQKLWEDEGAGGEAYTDMLIDCVHDCAENGVGIMVSHVAIGMDKHTPNALGLKRFERLVKAGESAGVVIAFENTEGEEYLASVMGAFKDSPACGFCLDTGHEQCYNYGKDMVSLYGANLVSTHLNDNFGMADVNVMTWHDDSHVMLGDGIVDWNGVKARLNEWHYDGILTMELTRNSKPNKHTHDAYAALSLEEFLRLALDKAKSIWG